MLTILKRFHTVYLIFKVKVKVVFSYPTFCDPVDYTVHGIVQAKMLEWIAFLFSRDLPNPVIKPRSPALQAGSLPADLQGSPEGWALRNWCFWIVLEKTLESPLDCKEIKSVSPKRNQPWILKGLMLKLKLQYFGHLMYRADSFGKDPDARKDWRQKKEERDKGWNG